MRAGIAPAPGTTVDRWKRRAGGPELDWRQNGHTTSVDTLRRHVGRHRRQLLNRLRRIDGPVRGVHGMVDADRYCIDVLTQISAVQAALDKVALGLLDEHVRHCVTEGDADNRPEMSDELLAAVARLMGRG
jgi:DNA-binding FrmR family transcriptional regulator